MLNFIQLYAYFYYNNEKINKLGKRYGMSWENGMGLALRVGMFIGNDRFEIKDIVYIGETSIVYKGFDHKNAMDVMVKEFVITHPTKIENIEMSYNRVEKSLRIDTYSSEKFDLHNQMLDTFLEEAKILRDLRGSKYIPVMVDTFSENNTSYIVTEVIGGQTLESLIESKKELPLALDTFLGELLNAVEFIHSKGYLHRDLKPENILISQDQICLCDFGISKSIDIKKDHHTIAFSIGYASPEQMTGDKAQGPWSDIYALGKIIQTLLDVYKDQFQLDVSTLKHYDLIIQKATALTPKERYQNILSLRRDLFKTKKKTSKFPKELVFSALFMLIILIPIAISSISKEDAYETDTQTSSTEIIISDTIDNSSITGPDSDSPESLEASGSLEASVVSDASIQPFVFEEMTFITENNTTFGAEGGMIEWTKPEGHKYFQIRLTDLSNWCYYLDPFMTSTDGSLDLTNLGLPPSNYRMYLFAFSEEDQFACYLKYIDFTIEGTSTTDSGMDFSSSFFNVKKGQSLNLALETENDYKLTILSFIDQDIVFQDDLSPDSSHSNTPSQDIIIPNFDYDEGLYLAVAEDQDTHEKVHALIGVTDAMPPYLVFQTPKNIFYPYQADEKRLAWDLLKYDTLSLTFNNIDTGTVTPIYINDLIDHIDLNDYIDESGYYIVEANYSLNGKWSPINQLMFIIEAP